MQLYILLHRISEAKKVSFTPLLYRLVTYRLQFFIHFKFSENFVSECVDFLLQNKQLS